MWLLLVKSFCKKKKKKLYPKTTLTTSTIALLTNTSRFLCPQNLSSKNCLNNLNPYTKIYLVFKHSFLQNFQIIIIFLNDYNNFKSSQYFWMITIFSNDYNTFKWLKYFWMITIINSWHHFYENKPRCKFHHLTHIFYRQNMNISYVPSLCFLLWILFILCLTIFSLNKTSLNFFNSVAILTPFAVLYYLPSIFFIEYIFHFNPTNSSIITAPD